MTLAYSLTEDDYLQSQLFISSYSERVKQQRKRRWIWVTAILLILGIVSYDSTDHFLTYYFLFAGLISAIFILDILHFYIKNTIKSMLRTFIKTTLTYPVTLLLLMKQ